jgi:hypothetical protein
LKRLIAVINNGDLAPACRARGAAMPAAAGRGVLPPRPRPRRPPSVVVPTLRLLSAQFVVVDLLLQGSRLECCCST